MVTDYSSFVYGDSNFWDATSPVQISVGNLQELAYLEDFIGFFFNLGSMVVVGVLLFLLLLVAQNTDLLLDEQDKNAINQSIVLITSAPE